MIERERGASPAHEEIARRPDEQVARVVRERAGAGEEPARTVRRAIEIGSRVLDREETAAEVDYVRRRSSSS